MKTKIFFTSVLACIISFGAEAQTYLRTVVSQNDTVAAVAAVVDLGDGRLMYRFTRDNSLLEGDYRILGNYRWRYEMAQFSGGLYDGKYQFIEDEKVYGEGTYKAGLLHGEYKNYHDNGSLRREVTFVDGEEHGEEREYYDNGKLQRLQNYNNGKLHGIGQYWELTDDGEHVLRGETNYINGEPDGKQISIYIWERNTLETSHYDNGVRTGEYMQTRFDGSLVMQGQYKNGEKDGVWTETRPNGNLRKISTYKNDKLNGEVKTFNTEGKLQKHEHFVNDELEGLSKEYDTDSGELKSEYTFTAGRRDGEFKVYASNGRLSREGRYDSGREVFVKEYHPNGNVKSIRNTNRNGQRHGENSTFFLDGTPENTANYVSGKAEGALRNYHSSTGKLREEYIYVDGERHGAYKFYFEDGKLRQEALYENGTMVSEKDYHDNGNLRRVRVRNSRGAWEGWEYYNSDGTKR